MSEGRILAIDYGERRAGVAISDPLGLTAQGLPNIEVSSDETLLSAIQQVVTERDVKTIVLGLPKNMDGSLGESAQKVLQIAEKLKELTGVQVETWDERLTTVRAERVLRDSGMKWRKRKQHKDRMAAQFILQAYLNAKPHRKVDE